jgi:hypothetical protein
MNNASQGGKPKAAADKRAQDIERLEHAVETARAELKRSKTLVEKLRRAAPEKQRP